jgi:hypothetical protein
MRYVRFLFAVAALAVWAGTLLGQHTPSPADNSGADASKTTVRGCLQGERGNYIVIEDKTGSLFVLKGVGNKLDSHLHHEVEVTGKVLSGTVKTGVRPEKTGSNPADVVHGVDGVPFQIADPKTDVRTVAKKCKAADQE